MAAKAYSDSGYKNGYRVGHHKFRGKKYEVIIAEELHPGDLWGFAESRRAKKPVVAFKEEMQDDNEHWVELLIHEALHACLEQLSEKQVNDTAIDIALFLRKMKVLKGKR